MSYRPAQSLVEPRITACVVIFAWLQRSMLVGVYTRYQLLGLLVSILAIEILVMPLLGRRPSFGSLTVNALLAAAAMVLAKWQVEGINWASAARRIAGFVSIIS